MTQVIQTSVQPGQPAPDFAVPAVQEDRLISLADYRGRTPLLLGLFPGLYCPFCRRALAQMAATSERLKPLGVESLAVVGTELENARLYSDSGRRGCPSAPILNSRPCTHTACRERR